MAFGFKLSLHTLFAPIIALFTGNMSNFEYHNYEKFDIYAGFNTATWCRAYLDGLKDPTRRHRYRYFTVVKLHMYKEMDESPFHEYVVAEVKVDKALTGTDDHEKLYYRVERFRTASSKKRSTLESLASLQEEAFSQELIASVSAELAMTSSEDELVAEENGVPSPTSEYDSQVEAERPTASKFASVSTLPRSIISSIDRINLTSDADDRVRMIHSLPTCNKKLIEVETIHPRSMTLIEFAILASSVSQKDRLYTLFRSQCYWFSNSIMRVAALDTSSKNNLNPDADMASDKVLISQAKHAGRWRKIRIHKTQEVVVKAIAALYYQNRMGLETDLAKIVEQERETSSKVARTEDAERRAEASERENEELKRQLAALKATSGHPNDIKG